MNLMSSRGIAALAAAVLLALPARAAPPRCAGLKTFALGDSCIACGGVVVKRLRRGRVHGVEVGGVFWTDASAGIYTNAAEGSEAQAVCRDKDAALRLPTKAELETLTAAFHREGDPACAAYDGLNAVMPDSVGRHHWTATPDAKNPKSAWMYWGTTNDPHVSDRGALGAVRCVGNPADAPAPPVDHAAAAPFPPDSPRRDQAFERCVTSLTHDSNAGPEVAYEACKTQDAPQSYLCVYHLTNAGAELKTAIDACQRDSSKEFVTCAVKSAAAPLQCLKTKAPPEGDASKLDRYRKSCDAGNLMGCVMTGKALAQQGDAAGAAPYFKKACAGGFQPGCDAAKP